MSLALSGLEGSSGDDYLFTGVPLNLRRLAGVSNLLASLGHTRRRRVVLGHTLNTQTLMKTDEQKNPFK